MTLFYCGLIALVTILAAITAMDAVQFRLLPWWRKRGQR